MKHKIRKTKKKHFHIAQMFIFAQKLHFPYITTLGGGGVFLFH